jgi:hypothetical protein
VFSVLTLIRFLALIAWIGAGRPFFFPYACVSACSLRGSSSPWMRIGADMQKSHGGCSVKYGATSQFRLERRFGRLEGRSVTAAKACVRGHGLRQAARTFRRSYAVAPVSIIRERAGASRLRSLGSPLTRP